MWETIRYVLTSPNATIVLIFISFIVIFGSAMSRSGNLSIRTKFVQIGAADRERNIIWRQSSWAKLHCYGLEGKIKKPDEYDPYMGKYIAELIYDEYVEWITMNHLVMDEKYIRDKQDRVVAIVSGLVVKPEFKTKEFQEMLRNDTKESIKMLINIREIYSKQR